MRDLFTSGRFILIKNKFVKFEFGIFSQVSLTDEVRELFHRKGVENFKKRKNNREFWSIWPMSDILDTFAIISKYGYLI